MKLLILPVALLTIQGLLAQPAKKPATSGKAPTQSEIQAMMRESQQMLDQLSPEDKRMMDSLGIKMPNLNQASRNMASVTDAQLQKAWEDENRIVPLKDAKRITIATQAVTATNLNTFLEKMNAGLAKRFSPKEISAGNQAYQWIKKQTNGSNIAMANAAIQLWILGKYKAAIFVMSKVTSNANVVNLDILNNYAALLTIAGAEEWALPILNYLDKQDPQNSTILNNIAQAWFGLGDMQKADEFTKKCLALCAWHPQANMIASKIAESKGNKTDAVKFAKQAMKNFTSPEKEAQLHKLGYSPQAGDYHIPTAKSADLFNLGGLEAPPFPKSVDECLAGAWKIFRKELDKEKERLSALARDAKQQAEQDQAARTKAGIDRVTASLGSSGGLANPNFAPMRAVASGKKQDELSKEWLRKMQALAEKRTAFIEGPGQQLKKDYEADIKALQKKDLEQTGEGKPNVDFCPQYKERSNKFLKAYNEPMEQFFKEQLIIYKTFINELANLQLYGSWPATYELQKIQDKQLWLIALSNEENHFQDITRYNCINKDTKDNHKGLAKFKDPKCEEMSTLDFGWASIATNCYETITKLDIDIFDIELFSGEMHQNDAKVRDAANTIDYIIQSFTNATIEFGPSADVALGKGPFKLEAEAGAKVVVELSKDGITDIGIKATGEVKATASEIKNNEDVGVKTDITIAGAEAKITVNSGFTVEGKGILKVFNP